MHAINQLLKNITFWGRPTIVHLPSGATQTNNYCVYPSKKNFQFLGNIYFFCQHNYAFDSLTNEKILDLPKLKAFTENNVNVIQKLKLALGEVENIVETEHFLFFPQAPPWWLSGELVGLITWWL